MSEIVSAEAEELRELIQQARAHLRGQQRLGVERLHVAWPERRGVAPAPSLTLTQVREELGECQRRRRHHAPALGPGDVKALDPQSLLATQMGASLGDQLSEVVEIRIG